jgi:GNAT superfamily N-acetyltransferase
MIRICKPTDRESIHRVINDAAAVYKGFIPCDCWHEPYMPLAELKREMGQMTFFGWEEQGKLLGVMGIQPVKDVVLIRHTYVLRDQQGRGIGSSLLSYAKGLTKKQLLVGTWSDATWAIRFYEKNGFRLMPNKDELLRRYWRIPPRQIETSVVLGLEPRWNKDAQ